MRSINYPLSSPAAGEKFFNCLIVYFSANARKKWGCGRFFLVNGSAAGVSAARDRRERSPLGRPRVTAVPSGVRAEEVNETQGRVPNRLPVRHRRLGAQPTARAAPSVGCPTDCPCGTVGWVPNRLPVRHRGLGAQPTARAAPPVGGPTAAAV